MVKVESSAKLGNPVYQFQYIIAGQGIGVIIELRDKEQLEQIVGDHHTDSDTALDCAVTDLAEWVASFPWAKK